MMLVALPVETTCPLNDLRVELPLLLGKPSLRIVVLAARLDGSLLLLCPPYLSFLQNGFGKLSSAKRWTDVLSQLENLLPTLNNSFGTLLPLLIRVLPLIAPSLSLSPRRKWLGCWNISLTVGHLVGFARYLLNL